MEPQTGERLKVSFIEFLNAVPLGWGFLRQKWRREVDLRCDVPSQCARQLAGAKADVGLIPVIEYQRIPGLRVLPDISIASKQEVRSVLFVSRKPLEKIASVALDSSSRTSVALLKIVLTQFYRLGPVRFEICRPDPAEMLEHHDAALIIGNAAMRLPRRPLYIFDLAGEWNRFTGLPFVFAFWGVRPGAELGDRLRLFYQSRQEGLEGFGEIARLYGPRLGLGEEEVRTYLSSHLDYSLDGENQRGLAAFYRLALENGLLDSVRPLDFYRSRTQTGVLSREHVG